MSERRQFEVGRKFSQAGELEYRLVGEAPVACEVPALAEGSFR